ncbi:uncharacterized protein LOC110689810 isoform X2 [Chenopodium quinoa]|uniref:uncharacterized protein LOC110689810 isoform X2 n=1 Tax=Chenopodium quinoa TaxID=63459 RepID=UPI000B77D0EF|nr:uncharacterized protein LOC110689810 isoform X2 [Chenopodium quinoa]
MNIVLHKTKAAFPDKRLGVGAFRIALESIFNRIHHTPLECVIYGKPEPIAFKNAEATLRQIHCDMNHESLDGHLNRNQSKNYFSALYMVGDNPSVDIKGAREMTHILDTLICVGHSRHFNMEQNHRSLSHHSRVHSDTYSCRRSLDICFDPNRFVPR